MSEESIAAIATAALLLALVAVVMQLTPMLDSSAPAPEKPPSPSPTKTADPPAAAPPPKTIEPIAQPETPQFQPHPTFASYMAGIEPTAILERYNAEPGYRSWFNDYFGTLTIRQATGFDAPPALPVTTPTTTPPPATAPPPTALLPSPAEPPQITPEATPPPVEQLQPLLEPTPTEPNNSAECNRLLAQLFNVNTPIEEFDRIESELVANSCSG